MGVTGRGALPPGRRRRLSDAVGIAVALTTLQGVSRGAYGVPLCTLVYGSPVVNGVFNVPAIGAENNLAGCTVEAAGVVNNSYVLLNYEPLVNVGTINNDETFTNLSTIDNANVVHNRLTGTLLNSAGTTFNNQAGGSTYNVGSLLNSGILTNAGFLLNQDTGILTNQYGGMLYNEGVLYSTYSGYLRNDAGGTLINNAYIVNATNAVYGGGAYHGPSGNAPVFANAGLLSNVGTFMNFEGQVANEAAGSLTNASYGLFTNDAAALNNAGTFTNDGYLANSYASTLVNAYGATLSNTGYLVNVLGSSITNEAGATLNNGAYATIANVGGYSPYAGYGGGGAYAYGVDGGPSTVTNAGALVNDGVIQNGAFLSAFVPSAPAESVFDNAGSLTNNFLVNNVAVAPGEVSTFGTGGTLLNEGGLYNYAGVTAGYGAGAVPAGAGPLAALTNTGALTNNAYVQNAAVLGVDSAGAYAPPVSGNGPVALLTNNGVFTSTETLTNYAYASYDGGFAAATAGPDFDNASATLHNTNAGTLTNTGTLTNAALARDAGLVPAPFGSVMRPAARLVNDGMLTNDYAFENYAIVGPGYVTSLAEVVNNQTFVNNGYLNNGFYTAGVGGAYVGSSLIRNTGAFDNNGSLENYASGSIVNEAGGVFTNAGSLINEGALHNDGILRNGALGTLYNDGAASTDGVIENAGVIENTGTFKVGASGSVTGNGGAYGSFTQYAGVSRINGSLVQDTVRLYGGSLIGNGLIGALSAPALAAAGSTISPGESPGTLQFAGDFTCATCTLVVEIAGYGPGMLDTVEISGSADLANGEIAFDFLNLFAPQAGDTFDFLFASDIAAFSDFSFDFTGLDPGFGFNVLLVSVPDLPFVSGAGGMIDALRLQVVSAPVPLPPGAWLLGAGLAGLAAVGRRRSRAGPKSG